MKNKRKPVLLTQVFILLFIVLFTGCEKRRIKKNYTGNFEFISINEGYYYISGNQNDPQITLQDTVVAEGTIDWVEDNIVIIAFANASYLAKVDDDGVLTFGGEKSPNEYSTGQTLEGYFKGKNELNFTHTLRYHHQDHVSIATHVVSGNRLQ